MTEHYRMLINIIVFQFHKENYGILTSREINFFVYNNT